MNENQRTMGRLLKVRCLLVYLLLQTSCSEIEPNHLHGVVFDFETGESIPYAEVILNGDSLETSFEGIFSSKEKVKSAAIVVRVPGYEVLDTFVQVSSSVRLGLKMGDLEPRPEVTWRGGRMTIEDSTGNLKSVIIE